LYLRQSSILSAAVIKRRRPRLMAITSWSQITPRCFADHLRPPPLNATEPGIEDGDYLAESKDISEIREKVTPLLNPQKAWLLADVPGR
jgi:hypothetical protein